MMYTEQIIVEAVMMHMRKSGGNFKDWYTGIATDARAKLFTDHGVKESGDAWICRQCNSANSAQEVERYFTKRGCKGGPAVVGQSVRYFYAYKIEEHTRQ